MKNFNYENDQYLESLNKLGNNYYSSYIKYIKENLINKNSKFLDVGCGSGTVLDLLKKEGYIKGYGIDVSKLFIKEAKSKGLKEIYFYDGNMLPFKDNFFDLVGSFNVLEHTENPLFYIKEQIRVTKKGGFIIIICPNFLSVMLFNNWHPLLKGGKRKLRNFLKIVDKLIINKNNFEKTNPVKVRKFKYDADAIVVTNLIDIKHELKKQKMKIIQESGFINYENSITKLFNYFSVLRYMSPSCVIVARK